VLQLGTSKVRDSNLGSFASRRLGPQFINFTNFCAHWISTRACTIWLLLLDSSSILRWNSRNRVGSSCMRLFFSCGTGAPVACICRMTYDPTPLTKPGERFINNLLGEGRAIGQNDLDSIW